MERKRIKLSCGEIELDPDDYVGAGEKLDEIAHKIIREHPREIDYRQAFARACAENHNLADIYIKGGVQ